MISLVDVLSVVRIFDVIFIWLVIRECMLKVNFVRVKRLERVLGLGNGSAFY